MLLFQVVVFMKGVPEAPRCGFSNAVVQVYYFLYMVNVTYSFIGVVPRNVNVLSLILICLPGLKPRK